MQSAIDPTQLIHLKISQEEFVWKPEWRQRIQFEPLDDTQPPSQAAYKETRARGLTWTESVRKAFTWELPGGTIQIESRDKARRIGWINGQMLFDARLNSKLQWEFLIGSESLPCQIVSPGGQRMLRVSEEDVLRGPFYPAPARPLLDEVYPHWNHLSEDQQLAFLAFWLFDSLELAFQAQTRDSG